MTVQTLFKKEPIPLRLAYDFTDTTGTFSSLCQFQRQRWKNRTLIETDPAKLELSSVYGNKGNTHWLRTEYHGWQWQKYNLKPN